MIAHRRRPHWRATPPTAVLFSRTWGEVMADRDRCAKGSRTWLLLDHATRCLELAIRSEMVDHNRRRTR